MSTRISELMRALAKSMAVAIGKLPPSCNELNDSTMQRAAAGAPCDLRKWKR